MIRILFFMLIVSAPLMLAAQRPGGQDSMPRSMPQRNIQGAGSGPRAYNEVITARAKTDEGLFKVHRVDEFYFFEIPDSLLGRDILVVNRISKGAAGVRIGMSGYAGDAIGENVIRFEKGPGNRLFLKNISYSERARDSTGDGMYRSVLNSNIQPIAVAFDIKAYFRDSVTSHRASVIDVTQFINTDNDILFFEANQKRAYSLGGLQTDRSYVEAVKSYPMNIEIKTVKTYMRAPAQQGPGGGQMQQMSSGPVTFELNSSLVLLPKVPMQPRYFDPRVGYFATGYTDFDANPQGVKRVVMITRWRLEPKPEDVEKYKRGELVEPQKPIVFYIDPTTPKKWVPYLIQGVNDWNVAFERAGWKNAIVAKEAPKNNPEWSLDDARHSAIVYKPSDIPNASGPHVHDPRSGEILETHVNWYHNVMQLVRNWYFIQTAAVDPKARKMKFDDELMGQLIRFVSSHEVGHTLGLRHNYGSSSTVPVENLRNKTWVEANGHTPSIMDYARFNYVAQPEDNISQAGLFPRIGEYDKWAIEWGYRWFPDYQTPDAERPKLNQWITEKISNSSYLWFGTETDPNDPRAQNEDLGDNAMKAGAYGIRNLKRILPNLMEWTKEPNEDYAGTRMMYNELVIQFGRYMGHVSKNIGGITTTPRMVEESGPVYDFVPRATQKDAINFIQQQLFTTPAWLLDKKIFQATGINGMTTIGNLQQGVLNRLLSPSTFDKLLQFESLDPKKAYLASELLSDLKKGIWTELTTKTTIDLYRRNLQKIYVERLVALVRPPERPAVQGQGSQQFQAPSMSKTNDAMSLLRGHMKALQADIRVTIPVVKDSATRLHLQDVHDRIASALKTDSE